MVSTLFEPLKFCSSMDTFLIFLFAFQSILYVSKTTNISSKFSEARKFTLRYHQFEINFKIWTKDCIFMRLYLHGLTAINFSHGRQLYGNSILFPFGILFHKSYF